MAWSPDPSRIITPLHGIAAVLSLSTAAPVVVAPLLFFVVGDRPTLGCGVLSILSVISPPPLPPPYMYPSLRFPPLEIHATCISALDRHHLLGLLWSGVRGTTPERLGGCVFVFYRVVDAEEDLWLAKGGGC